MRKDMEEKLEFSFGVKALCGTPVRKIREALECYRVNDLKWAASFYSISGISGLWKNDVAKVVAEKLLSAETLKKGLLCLEDNEWRFFRRVAAEETLVWDQSRSLAYWLPERLGLLQSYYDKKSNQLGCVVTNEIREAFHQLMDSGFELERARAGNTHSYAKAAVNLYGTIGLDELIPLLKDMTGCQFDYLELTRVLHIHETVGQGYFLSGSFLLHDSFRADGLEQAEKLLATVKDKPRYVPPEKVFLRYADDEYFEKTPQTDALARFLQQCRQLSGGMEYKIFAELFQKATVSDLCRRAATSNRSFKSLS